MTAAALLILLAPAPLPDPLPIRREVVAGGAPWPQTGAPALVMPLADFEARVQAAARAAVGRAAPRLAAARYAAEWSADALSGTGEWDVDAAGAGELPAGPLRVAVRGAEWADGATAVLTGEPSPALRVPGPGRRTLRFGWSSRSRPAPGADRFELSLPPAPVATLELTLPADSTPFADPAAVVSGPFPAKSPERRLWRVLFGGLSRLDLTVRRPAPGDDGGPIRASRTLKVTLGAAAATAESTWDWEAPRGAAELVAELDSGWRVAGVTSSLPARVDAEPPTPARPGGAVRVRPRGLPTSGRLTITLTADLPPSADGGWPLPRPRLAGTRPGGDTVELAVGPEWRFLGLDPGDYRPTDLQEGVAGTRVTLAGTLTAAGERRPAAPRFRPAEPAASVADDWQWLPNLAGGGVLRGRARLTAVRGPLPRAAFRVPAGYELRSHAGVPDDPGLTVTVGRDGGGTVEPSRPLATGQTMELRLELETPAPAGPADPRGRSAPLPRVEWPGASARVGGLRVAPPFGALAWAQPTPPAPGDGADVIYPPSVRWPEGTLTLLPRAGRLEGAAPVSVAARPDGAETTTALRVKPVPAVPLFLAGRPHVRWDVRPGPGGTAGPELPGEVAAAFCGALTPWAAVGLASTLSNGVFRVVEFRRPPRGAAEVRVAAVCDGDAAGVWRPLAGGAAGLPSPVELAGPAAARFAPVAPTPLGAVWEPLAPRAPADAGRPAAPGEAFANVRRTTRVDADGGLRATLSGEVDPSAARELTVSLPTGVADAELAVAGRAADAGAGPALTAALPAPAGERLPFELRYRLPAPEWGWVASPPPEVTGFDGEIPSAWEWSADWRPWPTLAPGGADAGPDARRFVPWSAVAAGSAALALAAAGLFAASRRTAVAVAALLMAGGLSGGAGWRAALAPALAVSALAAAVRRRPPPVPRAAGQSTVSHRRFGGSSRSAGALALLAAASLPGGAQAPAPAVVFVRGDEALAPVALLDQLARLAAPAPLPPAWSEASYDGAPADDSTSRWTADLVAAGASAVPTRIELPLAGGRLLGVTVDGAAALPESVAPDRAAVPLPPGGPWAVRLRFEASTTPLGVDRETRFRGPAVPRCRVRFAAPARGDVVSRLGEQVWEGGAVVAEQGGERGVAVRWGDPAAPAGRAAVSVAAVWELREADATLAAAAVFRLDGTPARRLELDVPDGVDPRGVSLRAGADVPLREVRVSPGANGFQRLTVVPSEPVAGRAVLLLKAPARRPPSAKQALRFPRVPGADDADALYGVRLVGLLADDVQRGPLIDVPADAALRDAPAAAELGIAQGTRLFRRDRPGTAEVRLTLRPPGVPGPASGDVVWTVGARADAEGVARVAARDGGFSFAEWEPPAGLEVRDVAGADVAGWSRLGGPVQVWFRRPQREAVLRWRGDLGAADAKLAARGVELPPAPDGVTPSARPAPGWALAGEWSAAAPGRPRPPGRFTAFPPGRGTVSGVVTRDGPRYRLLAELAVAPGRPATAALQLADWPAGAKVGRFEAGVAAEAVAAPGGPAWRLTIPAGSGRVRVEVDATLPEGAPAPSTVAWFGAAGVFVGVPPSGGL